MRNGPEMMSKLLYLKRREEPLALEGEGPAVLVVLAVDE